MIQKIGTGFVLAKTGFLTIKNVEESINKTLALLPEKCEFSQVCSIAPIVSETQILSAVGQASSFQAQNIGISTKLPLEFLVRLTASRQVKDAFEKVKLKQGQDPVVLVFCSPHKQSVQPAFKQFCSRSEFIEKPGLIQKNLKENFSQLCKLYTVSETELKTVNAKDKFQALQNLVLERIACLELNH